MNANRRSIVFYSALTCAALGSNFCDADYLGRFPSDGVPPGNLYGAVRITDNGALTPVDYTNTVPSNVRSNFETYGQAVAVSPDLKKVYDFVNTLGFSNYIIASDANTGQYLANDTIVLSSTAPPNPPDAYIEQAKQPLVTTSNELFVLSIIDQHSGPITWQIKHFDLATKSFIESIDPPTPQAIDDIAYRAFGAPLGLGDQLYFSTPSGIYVEQRTNVLSQAFGSVSPSTLPLIPGVDGNIAIGPDNRLYIRNFANGDIQRYSLTGQFIDTLISHSNFPNMGTIQFGVDGNLHVYQGVEFASQFLTFNPLTGNLLSSTSGNRIFPGRITYIPVPEPCSISLFTTAIIAVSLSRRRRRDK